MVAVFFDDSLPIAVDAVGRLLGDSDSAIYLRDGQGQLHIYVGDGTPTHLQETLEAELRATLGSYAPKFGPIVREGAPNGEPALLVVGDKRLRYVERRFAGADWTLKPVPLVQKPPRLVFYSIKGGVGRTTALTVLAAEIASRGGTVLCVDLDLEAPGLGHALLPSDATPEFGALDWLTERAVQGAEGTLPPMSRLVGTSPIGRHQGRIDVIPAFGERSIKNSASVLAKLSRTVIESSEAGRTITFGSRLSSLLDEASKVRVYDVILIDARAGLSEISAGPLIGLGADVLLFMADGNQSFATYSALLAHLQRFAPTGVEDDDWRLRFKAVRGRIANPSDPTAATRFLDRVAGVFAENLYDAPDDASDLDAFNFALDDVDAPHHPLSIAFDPRFQTFEPLEFGEQAEPSVVEAAFGTFNRWCIERLRLFEGV